MDDVSGPPSILLLAYGNISRGDDALAPLLLEKLQQSHLQKAWGFTLQFVEDYQIQVEHVMDMLNCERVVLIDASQSLQQPFSFYRVEEKEQTCYTTHGMSASNLLHTYRQVHRCPPPDTYMLAIQGIQFELGQPLSVQAENNLKQASSFLTCLLHEHEPQRWDALAR